MTAMMTRGFLAVRRIPRTNALSKKGFFTSTTPQTTASATNSSSTTTTTTTTTTQSHKIQARLLKSIHPLHLFRIVQDVDQYQDFLPFCGHSCVFLDTIQNHGRQFEAELEVGLGPFQTRYRSQVSVDPEHLIISTTSGKSNNNTANNSSMFDSLSSEWKLRPVVGNDAAANVVSTQVDFRVEMTVSDPMIETVLNQVLVQMAETQVKAFEERCWALPPPTPDELVRAEEFFDTTSTTTMQ